MNCARVERWLALRVEGDLGTDESRYVENHLAACPDCRAAAASYERSQLFLRSGGPAPFDERDYAAIRRAVGERLEADASRRLRFGDVLHFFEGKKGTAEPMGWRRFMEALLFFERKMGAAGFVTAGVLLIALIAALSWAGRQPTRSGEEVSVFPSQKKSAPAALPSLAVGSGEEVALLPSQKNAAPGVAVKPATRRGAGVSLSPARTVPVRMVLSRIELQTNNPNVRIIWLVGSQPAAVPSEPDSGS